MSTLRAAFARGYFRFLRFVGSVFVRDIAVRGVAILLLAAIVLPGIVIEATPSVKASSKPEIRPVNAPLEPFRINGSELGTGSLRNTISSIDAYFSELLSSGVGSQGSLQDPSIEPAKDESIASESQEPSAPVSAEPAQSSNDSVRSESGQMPDGSESNITSESSSSGPEAPLADEVETEPAMMTQPASSVDFDFDGDGKSDIGRWHPQTAEFKVKNSNSGSYSTWTLGSAPSSAKPAPADYDNDGMTDAAVFNNGTWTIRKSSDGNTTTISSFGQSGDIPMSGDYRGDTADELVVYRPSTGYWYWREFGNGTVYSLQWGGTAGDIAAPGDYDADGKMDWTVYRASTGYWWVLFNNSSGYTAFPWGISIDIPVQADYDGDGTTDPAIWRPTDGVWWYLKSSTGYSTYGSITWGNIGDQPAIGDYDDDDEADFTVFRETTGKWHTFTSQNNYQGADLGIAGDTAIPSSYVKQSGSQISPDLINKERLKARNATGGTDLFSQNFGWSRNLLSLPGRSGMDLNVGLSYNSLIWLKVDTAMLFDTDEHVGMAPGFRVGFPTVEPSYYNDDTDKWNYLMVTPSGAKVEFRQTEGAANVYETHDSSYAQLTTTGATNPNDPVEDITLKVVTTDGTQMSYDWISGAFRCTQIKDRNGNYISVTYDTSDRGIATITDTLGRVVTFNYTDQHLSSITQTWKTNNGADDNTTHTYATLAYTTKTVAHDFHDSLTVWGPYNGTELKVLDKVTYADGSFTKFHYNGYAQVTKVEEHAADSGGTAHVLNHVRLNLHTSGDGALSADQTDVPRFTKVWNYAENFNSGSETLADITRTTGQSYTSPAGGSAITSTKIEVEMDNHPHNSISKSWYHESGWKDGLQFATEDWADGTSGSELKRWSLTTYEQDDTGVSYQMNPRVLERKVGDGTSTKRTLIEYNYLPTSTIAIFGLPMVVYEYDSDQSTVLRQTNIDYVTSSNYEDRRIIGLPSTVLKYGRNQSTSSLDLASKVTFAYDEGNFSDSGLVQNVTPTQHDSTNYGTGFSYRGNITSSTRWDATAPTTSGSSIVTSSLKYNTAGSVVSKTTPWDGTYNRTVRIGYSDNFNSSPGVTTNAYPTVITAPNGSSLGDSAYSSTIKYRYDIGANVEANSPAPTGLSYGKKSKRVFDTVGRLEKDSVFVNTTEQSYVRYEYPTNGIQRKVFRTLVDVDNDTSIADDETETQTLLDGAGRVRMIRNDHPGSTGGYSAVVSEYDILGRVKRQSVPTEVDSSWDPDGDDTAGLKWKYQKYDWMNRVIRAINTDGADDPSPNDSDIFVTYEGCGCAGGTVTTVESERVPIPGDAEGDLARRKQKIYKDILGRTYKVERYEWDGSTVYSTTLDTFNERDQVLRSRQFVGNTSSGTYQDSTATFDGHGRISTSHKPEQISGGSPAYTTTTYFPDDSIASVTDARGAEQEFLYNALGKVVSVGFSAPYPIQSPYGHSFTYDNLGNRTAKNGFSTSTSYVYDSLSRIASETQTFIDLYSNEYELTYQYSPGGLLTQMTDGLGGTLNYKYDKAGRSSEIGSSGYGTSDPLVDNIDYRAWGAKKSESYDDDTTLDLGYNSRQQMSSFVWDSTDSGDHVKSIFKDYGYYADGRMKYSKQRNDDATYFPTPSEFDRAWQYDHAGRLQKAFTASSAWEQVIDPEEDPVFGNEPYKNQRTYNAYDNITQTKDDIWALGEETKNYSMTNNRISGWTYDADGRPVTVPDGGSNYYYKYDAKGQMWEKKIGTTSSLPEEYQYGADRELAYYTTYYGSSTQWKTDHYVRSTVLGGKEILKVRSSNTYVTGEPNGVRRFVRRSDGEVLATYEHMYGSSYQLVYQHAEPSGESYSSERGQKDSRGIDVGNVDPATQAYNDWLGMYGGSMFPDGGFMDPNGNCTVDGISTSQYLCDIYLFRIERDLRSSGAGSLYTGFFTDEPYGHWEDVEVDHGTPEIDEIRIHTDNRFVVDGYTTTFHPGIQIQQTDAQKVAILTERWNRAIKRLENPECLNAVAPPGSVPTLITREIGALNQENNPYHPDTIATTQRGVLANGQRAASIRFNSNGMFFTGTTAAGQDLGAFFTAAVRQRTGVGGLSVELIMELAILHEIAHAYDRAGARNDRGGENPSLNTLIREKCFFDTPTSLEGVAYPGAVGLPPR